MPFHRLYLFPIIIGVFIGVIWLISSIPFFNELEKRVLFLIAGLILFGTFILISETSGQ
jgi:hypothetical protein